MRKTLWATFAVLTLTGPAASADKPTEGPNKPLIVLTDGHGHYIAIGGPRARTFHYGDRRGLYAQSVYSFGGGEKKYSWTFWSPSASSIAKGGSREYGGTLYRRGDKWHVECGARKTQLLVADRGTTEKLNKAKLLPPKHTRRIRFVGRDELGNFFYLDHEKHRRFRMWIGKPGAMKRLKLRISLDDSVGFAFGTKAGTLSHVRKKKDYWWIEKSKRTEVFKLDGKIAAYTAYSELGIYSNDLGTPCDHM